ncbi:hypothetical protein ACFLZH_03675, partial [Patescibacteria group bacterium]
MSKTHLKTAIDKGLAKGMEAAVDTKESKVLFAKEVQYQAYRIENVLKIKDARKLREFVKKDSKWYNKPMLVNFLDSYKGKNLNSFIEKAKNATQSEREALLNGIRNVIYKAKKAKYIEKAGPQKMQQEEDKETQRLKGLIEKDLNGEELVDIETSLHDPFVVSDKKTSFKEFQQHYLKIVTGQKALAVHAQSMQKKYNDAMGKAQAFHKKYDSGWRHYAGLADWGWRKAKGGYGTVKGWYSTAKGWFSKSKPKPKPKKPSPSEKINKMIAKVKDFYEGRMSRVKNLKNNLTNRSNEMKIGLGTYKNGIRDKLKVLIARGDWAKAREKQRELLKEQLIQKKQVFEKSLQFASKKGDEIDKAKAGAGALSADLQRGYKIAKGGEKNINIKIGAVLARVKQLEKYYGSGDQRVIYIRRKVLAPLLESRDKILTAKTDTSVKITAVDNKHQKLDVLKANVYLAQTSSLDSINLLGDKITKQKRKIDILKDKRFELHKLLEGMEFAYAAVDEFKGNIGKNLDKMNSDNGKLMDGLGTQLGYLRKTKVSPPGLGTSLYNTVGIGKWGFYGAAIELPFKWLPRAIGYGGAKLVGSDVKWKDTENWHGPGAINWLTNKYEKWLEKGAWSQYASKDSKNIRTVLMGPNSVMGILGAATGIIGGVNTLVFETPKAIDAMGTMVTDWKAFKTAMGSVINLNHWSEGRYGVAFGKNVGDVLVLLLTWGTGTGASAAGKAGAAGGRMARVLAVVGEGGRRAAVTTGRAGRFVIGVEVGTKVTAGAVVGGVARLPIRVAAGLARGAGRLGMRILYLGKGLVTGQGLAPLRMYLRRLLAGQADDILSSPALKEMSGRINSLEGKIANLKKLKGKAKKAKTKLSPEDATKLAKWEKELAKLQKEYPRMLQQVIQESPGALTILRESQIKGGTKLRKSMDDVLTLLTRKNSPFLKGNLSKTVKSSELRNLIEKARGKGIHKLSPKELGQLYQGLGQHMYQRSGLVVRTQMESLRNAVGRFMKHRAQLEAIDIFLNAKNVPMRTATLLTQDPMTVLGVRSLQQRIKLKLSNIEQRIVKLQKKKPGLTTELQKLLNNKAALKIKLDSLSVWRMIGNKPRLMFESAKTKVMNFARQPAKEIVKDIGKFFAMPVWAPYKYIKAFYFELNSAKAAQILRGHGIKKITKNVKSLDKLAQWKAFSDASIEVNKLVRAGNLKEAVRVYHSARVLGKQIKMPVAALDASFIAHLHRVMPPAVLYLDRVVDLFDTEILQGLPDHVKIDSAAWKRSSERHARMMMKMTQTIKIGKSFVAPEKPKKAKSSHTQRIGRSIKQNSLAFYSASKRVVTSAYRKAAKVEYKSLPGRIISKIKLPSWMSRKSISDLFSRAKTSTVSGTKSAIEATSKLRALAKADEMVDKSIKEGNLRKAIEGYHTVKKLGSDLTGKASNQWDSLYLNYLKKVIPESKKHIANA